MIYEERPEDRLRLRKLVVLDDEHRALQLRREAQLRGEKLRAKNAEARESEPCLDEAMAEIAEKKERRLAYNRRWYRENKVKKRA